MIALLTTSDPVKLSAVAALLVEGGVRSLSGDHPQTHHGR